MRMPSWVSCLLLAPALALASGGQTTLPSGGAVRYTVKAAQTRLEIQRPGHKSLRVSLNRDASVDAKAPPSALRVVGEVANAAIVLVDSYPSIPGGLSYCQAGEEKFLRVVSVAAAPARETWRIKLESCRENIELASPGLEWDAASSTLRIHWLQGPSEKLKAEERALRIGSDGAPVAN